MSRLGKKSTFRIFGEVFEELEKICLTKRIRKQHIRKKENAH